MSSQSAKCFSVTLCLSGDALDPMVMEGLLGLPTTIVGIKGQPRTGKFGRKYAPHETNLWSHYISCADDAGFDERIQALFASLGDRVEHLRALCQTGGVRGVLFCGFGSANGQGGGTIQAATMKLVADAALHLELDLYPLPRKSVFVLQHSRLVDEVHDTVKMIGAFGTGEDARAAVEQLQDKPGFRKYPRLIEPEVDAEEEGFFIDEYELDRVHWCEGFCV